MKKILGLFLIAALLFSACSIFENDESKEEKLDMGQLEVPDDFSYRTTNEVDVSITCRMPSGEALSGIHFALYDKLPEEGGVLLSQGATQADGLYETKICLPTYFDSLTIRGFMMTETVEIIDDKVIFDVSNPPENTVSKQNYSSNSRDVTFNYLTYHNSYGIPYNMEYDIISGDLLTKVNASLPENMPVPTYHPDYLASGSVLNIVLDEAADVWITFVHEGAGYNNALGFYTYDLDTGPPSSPESLTHTIIFPNTSIGYRYLTSGNKLYLGEFPAGTVIGWFLVQDGWRWGSVSTYATRYYSDPQFNPESNDDEKQHTILLYDDDEEKLLLAFEDLTRPYGDADFNDAIFYVTANPIEAVDIDNVNPIDVTEDEDNDGISDVYDNYPEDPTRAFDNYYPAENTFGTLGFEDYWPKQGDYDMNDLVVGYNFHNVHDPQNRLKEITGKIKVLAIGAGFHNGFAIELPFAENQIETFTSGNWTTLENDAQNAIINVFADAYDLINPPGEGFINTQIGHPYYQPVLDSFFVSTNSGLNLDDLDYLPPYNPFLRSNGDYNREVHLPDYPPTDFADPDYFQTDDDDSIPFLGRYYKTTTNLPWAIHLPQTWQHPIEKMQISWGYLQFADWAESGGTVNDEWYFLQDDRINEDFIYLPE